MPHPGAYRGNKRQKELKRLQKREDKKQKKLLRKTGGPGEPELLEGDMEGETAPEAAPGEAPGTPEAPAAPAGDETT